MITSINHSGIIVQDLDAMERFYTEDLGLKVTARYESSGGERGDHAGIPGCERQEVFLGLDEEGHQIELLYYATPISGEGHLDLHQLGATHICFIVDDLTKAHDDLIAKGVRFAREPWFGTTPDGYDWGAAYFQDPEGNWLELIQL
jgi:catechol 2,3-dioxygenase-like lactoylglutathione lyase family enzyme